MNDAVDVDVVIPVHDRCGPVVEAVASVLAQEGPSFVVHVVDDGSTDASAAVVAEMAAEDPRVVLHRQPNRGPSAARNRGLRAGAAPLVTFLDSDDLMVEDRLAFSVDHLRSSPGTDVVVGTERIEVAEGLEPPRAMEPQIDKAAPRYYWHTAVLPRAAIESIGGYDEALWYGEDLDVAFRLRRAGYAVDYVDRDLVTRRVLGDNLSYGGEEHADVLLGLVRAARQENR